MREDLRQRCRIKGRGLGHALFPAVLLPLLLMAASAAPAAAQEWEDGSVTDRDPDPFERTVRVDDNTVRTERVDRNGKVLRSETVRTSSDGRTEVIQRVESVGGEGTGEPGGYRIDDYPERPR